MMLKARIHNEDISVINTYVVTNNTVTIFMMHKLQEM